MHVFVYEYFSAAGRAATDSLRSEGWAMLSALMEDLAGVPGVRPITFMQEDGGHRCTAGACRRVQTRDEEAVFREWARESDYSLIIAPEFDDILRIRTCWVEEVGGKLLGSSPAGVELTADKLALSRYLQERSIPTPETFLLREHQAIPGSLFPMVLKPRYGAGSQATFLVERPDRLGCCVDQARAQGWTREFLVQRFVPGRPASIAFLVGPRSLQPLLPASQSLSPDGRFRYLGGSVPLPPGLAERTIHLARLAVETVPGLRGYVGVDVVLGDAENDWVIEINPRLTTSYIGLRALAETNLAKAWLDIARVGATSPLTWRPGVAHFQAGGEVALQGTATAASSVRSSMSGAPLQKSL